MRHRGEQGIALLTTMMVMLLLSSLLIGFGVMVASDSQLSAGDLGRTEAFYAAQAGLEQLTSDLGMLFVTTPQPTGTQVNALMATPPLIPDTQFLEPDDTSGYLIAFPATAGGDPATQVLNVASGPFAGLVGHVTPYTLTVTARKGEGAEASVERTIQTVRMPIFEFGVFASQDVSVFPDPAVTIDGFIHTNGSLYAATNGGPLQFPSRISAGGEVIRTHLPNDYPVDVWGGNVDVTTAPGVFRDLEPTEGSLVGALGSAQNEPTWFNLSTGTYNSRLINGRTGARPLQLPVTILGGEPIDLIRRPIPGETVNAPLFPERHFSRASVRILVSDLPTEITALPGVTGTLPMNLAADACCAFALSKEGVDTMHASYEADYLFPLNDSLLRGFLKIEIQTAPGSWTDVTSEVLGLGYIGRAVQAGGPAACPTDPHPDAIIRVQHVRETPTTDAPCGPSPPAFDGYEYWPNVLFDAREGLEREDATPLVDNDPHLGGLMHYIELDVGNLTRWLSGVLPGSGTSAIQQPGATGLLDGGYLVYFSDRRGNKDPLIETGEYGFEDFVNTGPAGASNLIREPGEDVNGNGTLEVYGMDAMGGGNPPLDANARPWNTVTTEVARRNPPVFFRRALKLVNGGLGQLPTAGLTVSAENPVYVLGHYNASAAGFGDPHTSAAIIADAITLLSTAWDDWISLNTPHSPPAAATTYYRFAAATGTSLSFSDPGSATGFGTDGGLQNLLRLVENWSGQTLAYRGSLAPLWISRQARGTYKCCGGNVFVAPSTLDFQHDADFLNLTTQPPATPQITDVNITGFRQILQAQ